MYLFDVLYLLRYQNCSIFIDNKDSRELIQIIPENKLHNTGLEMMKKLGRKWLDRKVLYIKATAYRHVNIYIQSSVEDEMDSILEDLANEIE